VTGAPARERSERPSGTALPAGDRERRRGACGAAARLLLDACGASALAVGAWWAARGAPDAFVPDAARVALAVLVAVLLPAVPAGTAEIVRGRAATGRAGPVAEMAQSLAFSYALVLAWLDLALLGPLHWLVGDLLVARRVQVGAFLEDLGWVVAAGGAGLFVLGLLLGESGRRRQAIPRMGSGLVLGLAYLAHTRGLAARARAGDALSVEGLVLFPAAALALIQLYAGSRRFADDPDVAARPGLAAALAVAAAAAAIALLAAIAALAAGLAAGDPLVRTIAAAGPCVAPMLIGWAQARMAGELDGEPLLAPALYRGTAGLGLAAGAAGAFAG
jgi:hypothetical protein